MAVSGNSPTGYRGRTLSACRIPHAILDLPPKASASGCACKHMQSLVLYGVLNSVVQGFLTPPLGPAANLPHRRHDHACVLCSAWRASKNLVLLQPMPPVRTNGIHPRDDSTPLHAGRVHDRLPIVHAREHAGGVNGQVSIQPTRPIDGWSPSQPDLNRGWLLNVPMPPLDGHLEGGDFASCE